VACEGASAFSGDKSVLDGVGDGAWLSVVIVFREKLFGALSGGIIANGVLSPVPISIRACEKVVMVASDL